MAGYYYELMSQWPPKSTSPFLSRAHIFLGLLFLLCGFILGRISVPSVETLPGLKVNFLQKTFNYEAIYSGRPSDASDAAWHTLFPIQNGFFRHPELQGKRAALSVYHQLHCLNGMRHAYWLAYDAASQGKKLDLSQLSHTETPTHFSHCTDLIRHALMCQPDTTVEYRNDTAGGVSGFGAVHQCKDWDQLFQWTSKWESYGQKLDQKDVVN